MSTGPVLVLGLDGAGWPVIEPLIASGSMPFLARLVTTGVRGDLRSPWPGSTFPSWTSIMTGVSPGVHGMLDFTAFDPPTYSVRFIESSSRRTPAIWELAHRAGRVCAVLGVPGTFPPDTAVDLMVAGFDTPVTTSTEPSFIHPPSWRKRLAAAGGFPLTPVQELRIGPGWHRKAWQALQGSIEGKTRIAELVLRELRPDLFVMVFGESDTVCHHFWPFADSESPRRREGETAGLDAAIRDIYSRLDTALERIVSAASDPELVMVVSDHGFGGAGIDAIHINRFLAQRGFLRFGAKSQPSPRVPSVLQAASLLPRGTQQRLFRRAKGLAGRLESRRRLGGIVWDETTAFSEELPYAPAVRLNVRGREGRGTVAPSRYESVRDEIAQALENWRDRETGAMVVRRVLRREEAYQGPAVSAMPDLLLDLAIPGGYTYVVASSGGSMGPVQVRLDPRVLGAKGWGMNGTHRREGIFVATGGSLTAGRIAGTIHSEQVAASILASLAVPVPASMSLPPAELPHAPRDGKKGAPSPRIHADETSWEWDRLRRLKELGYLD
ncbi:alkaline phosphatase family protein [Candidatus Fermentibacteria bacterium]|nr:alkaline phosphatase family protein [Candidatus Fermentibacteria bacterium]